MGTGVGGGLVGIDVGSDVDVFVVIGGDVGIVGDEPSNGCRQAAKRKASNTREICLFFMLLFPSCPHPNHLPKGEGNRGLRFFLSCGESLRDAG